MKQTSVLIVWGEKKKGLLCEYEVFKALAH